MTLNFTSWILCPTGPTSIGYQYDNLTDVLQVTGTVPAGWSWDLMVQCGTNLNIIPMEQAEDGSLSVVLTAEMIPLTGYYTMQLRATQGELVKYTNQFQAYVGASLSGDAQWPTVPTEFTQVEQNILDLNQHPPYPGDAGYWMTWDLESGAYVQSQLPLPPVAEGPPGKAATIQVGATTTGEPGTEATVQNVGNENAAILNFTVPAGPAGPTGTTPDISVRVSGLPAGSEPTVSVSGTPEAPVIYLGIPAGQQGTPGTPGTNGTDGTDGQTPNITIGTVETLPAGSNVTASITGQTPNLVLNLGIPQGPAGAGVPSTEGVPTDYLLSPAGWVAPPSGAKQWRLIVDQTIQEDVATISVSQDSSGAPFSLSEFYVLLESAVATENPAMYFNTLVNQRTTIANNTQQIHTSVKRYYYMYTKVIPEIATLAWHQCTTFAYNQQTQMQQKLIAYGPRPKTVTSLFLRSEGTEKTIAGPGSRLRIWGVDA